MDKENAAKVIQKWWKKYRKVLMCEDCEMCGCFPELESNQRKRQCSCYMPVLVSYETFLKYENEGRNVWIHQNNPRN